MRNVMAAVALVASLVSLTLRTSIRAQDLKATLEAARKAMGPVYTLRYSGTGTMAAFGQAYAPGGPWATFKVTSHSALLNYTDDSMRLEIERTNPPPPVRGGGGLPLFGPNNPQRLIQALSNRTAWNVIANPAQAPIRTCRRRLRSPCGSSTSGPRRTRCSPPPKPTTPP
jgi:hypothetical protein